MNDFIVCRCEGVTLSDILQSIEEGASAIPGVKKRMRVGMGPCQGRVCQSYIYEILQASEKCEGEPIWQKSQTPVRPTLMADMMLPKDLKINEMQGKGEL